MHRQEVNRFMGDAFLTAEEIYAIDDLTDATLGEFVAPLAQEKRELVLHYFGRIRNLRLTRVLLDERVEYINSLKRLLEENGVNIDELSNILEKRAK
jgi:hypothetical protein